MKNKIVICVCLVVLVIALVVAAIIYSNGGSIKKDPLDDIETVATLIESGYKLDIKSDKKGVEKTTDDQLYIITVEDKEYIGEKATKNKNSNEEASNEEEEDQRDYWDNLYTVVYKNIFEHKASSDFSNVDTWETIGINNKKYKYNIIGDKAELVYEIDDKSYMLIEVTYISKVKYDKDGNVLEKDTTDLKEEILRSENISNAIRFKVKKFDPETDKMPEEKKEPESDNNVSEDAKKDNTVENNETK